MPVLTPTAKEKTTVEDVKKSFRLARFVAALALDSARLQDFVADPEEAMADAGLSHEEKKLLRHDNFKNLCDYLWKVGPRPTGEDEPGGTGSGSG